MSTLRAEHHTVSITPAQDVICLPEEQAYCCCVLCVHLILLQPKAKKSFDVYNGLDSANVPLFYRLPDFFSLVWQQEWTYSLVLFDSL